MDRQPAVRKFDLRCARGDHGWVARGACFFLTKQLKRDRPLFQRVACAWVARLHYVGSKGLAEREGFPACEYADCTLCCWGGQSTLCRTARDWKRKSYVRHPAVKPLDLRFDPSWTNRTNKAQASTLPAIFSGCNRFSHQQLIPEFGEPAADRYITSCLLIIREGSCKWAGGQLPIRRPEVSSSR